MKPNHKESYEEFKVGDDVEYKSQRMTILSKEVLSNGIILFDLEADKHIHREIPDWCCMMPKYRKDELVPSTILLTLKSLFK
jgi:hypothetical protein